MRSSPPTRSIQLDTTPILGLVAILIPLLLMAYAPQVLVAIDSEAPSLCAGPCGSGIDETVTPTLKLSATGIQLDQVVLGTGKALGTQELPCEGVCRSAEDYDWKAVQELLTTTRAETASTGRVFIVPTDAVPYETVVEAMDACRERIRPDGTTEPLYPFPVLGAVL